MKISHYSIPGVKQFLALQKHLAQRMVWPYSFETDSLFRWRAFILSSILVAGLLFGSFALFPAILLIIQQNAWGLAFVDFTALLLNLIFLFVHKIRFEIRAGVTLLIFFIIGIAVILSIGPLSGGPAWLFAFALLAGVLMGNRAALSAILLNAISLALIGYFMSTGKYGSEFAFFNSRQAMITAFINFMMLNAITAVSVSALLNVLIKSESRYSLMANNVADVIWTMDMNMTITYVSPSIRHMQGFTIDEVIGKTLNGFIAPNSLETIFNLYELKMKQLEKRDPAAWEPVVFEVEQYCRDGRMIWTNINARLIKEKGYQAKGILGITRDITQRKKDEAEKIKAQMIADEHKKLSLVGQVAGKMAHDFNNVLGIIMGHSELAMLNAKDPETRETFELIFNQTLRGRNLTKNLVAFAKSAEPKQEVFELNEKIDLVLNLLKNDLSGIKVTKALSEDITLLADPGMIEHTFVNLIQNAIHALSLTRNPEIIIRTSRKDQTVLFEIEDNGCGIPEEFLEKIYEPAFTLKGSNDTRNAYDPGIKGTGYGMSNVKKYIDLHKGTIGLHSKPGKGTRICIHLPVIEKGLTRDEVKKLKIGKLHSAKKILLVEDEISISKIQETILSHPPCDHLVDAVFNGETALAKFRENNYDLVSLDYVLPGNINGMDIYHLIRGENSSVPILFISGNIEFLESIEALKQDDPNIDHISKPCRNFEYINRINLLLSRTLVNS